MLDIDIALLALSQAWVWATVSATWFYVMLALAHSDGMAYPRAMTDALAMAG